MLIKNPPPISRGGPINSLTGLRFFAAVGVVFFHYGKQHAQRFPDLVRNVLGGGANGVALFFMLSGFVLAYNYSESVRRGGLDKAEFWKARFARIYPVYALSLLLTLNRFSGYLHAVLQPFTRSNLIRAITSFAMVVTLTQAWERDRSVLWNFPAWTLSVEMLFYFTFPWACVAICKLKPSRLLPACAGLIFFSFAARAACLILTSRIPALTKHSDFLIWTLNTWPLMRLPEFLAGLTMGRMYLVRPEARINARNIVSILSMIGVLLVLAFSPPPATLEPALLEPFFALLIYTLASGPGIVAGFLSRPSLVLLGNASYAVYILQVPVMTSSARILGSSGLTFWVALFALTGISVAVYLYFETPARKWIRGRLTNRNEALRAVAALD